VQVVAHFALHAAALRAVSHGAAPAAPSVRLGLAGDCMWVRDTWADFLSPRTRAALESCDAVVANLETPLHARTPRDPLWLAQARLVLPAPVPQLRLPLLLTWQRAVPPARHGVLFVACRVSGRVCATQHRTAWRCHAAAAADGRVHHRQQPQRGHGLCRVRHRF
jgi:hypothetical protein